VVPAAREEKAARAKMAEKVAKVEMVRTVNWDDTAVMEVPVATGALAALEDKLETGV
jgi:hypothetical protein